MSKYLIILAMIITNTLFAQIPGDTIVVKSLNYSSTSRDTIVSFPNQPNITYQKILMLYNMRCKNGLVSPGTAGQTNIGCGEWDYTCNTYITDSSKIDSVRTIAPSHIIGGYTGNSFPYTSLPTYTYYQSTQQQVTIDSTISETIGVIGTGSQVSDLSINTSLSSHKSQYLYTASELLGAGLIAGNLSGLQLWANSTSTVPFLKIKIKATSLSELQNNAALQSGFTEVYYQNTAVVSGMNHFQFHTPFTWNGIDNLIIEFTSINNSSQPTLLQADSTSISMGLVTAATDYYFDFDGSNRINLIPNNLNTISNEVSLCFWARGNAQQLPLNTSILYATNSLGHRQANIHMPWSNENIFWDCGSGGSYDRINKLATPAQYEGIWHYWCFTKNSSTGIMNIYLDGSLWHSGTGKTISLLFDSFNLGSTETNTNPYFGSIDDFSIWKKDLPAATIAEQSYQKIDASHPYYSDLVQNYELNSASGNLALEVLTNTHGVVIGNQQWKQHRGENIFKHLAEEYKRPRIGFVQGNYITSTTTTDVIDSVINNPYAIKYYSVINNNLQLDSTVSQYIAGYTYVYENNVIIDSVNNPLVNTINISNLTYYRRNPSHFQIMSFVTPYGINLNMGMQGKTWTFDVTDFAPILKGNKRLFMNGGGEYQEQMDIQFLFIVGTPPREVKDITNIWKVDNAGYTSIMNNSIFESRQVTVPSGNYYKIRTAITGHGQEGEFIPQVHRLLVNGSQFNWLVWKKCGQNPVYPQGGTWIYDRAGWCPGMATDSRETIIDSLVNSGSPATIDYTVDTASGNSNYWVSNQLVTYGPMNHTLDGAIEDVVHPTQKVEYARLNPICNSPQITFANLGSTPITSIKFQYWLNNNIQNKQEFTLQNVSFPFNSKNNINLPEGSLWQGVTSVNNTFTVKIVSVNNTTDQNLTNDTYTSSFQLSEVQPSQFILELRTNNAGNETSYQLLDKNGNVIVNRNNLANATFYRDTLTLDEGCYSLFINDNDNDGISFWANNDGSGFARLKKLNGTILKSFQGDFGEQLIYNFSVAFPLSYEQLYGDNEIEIYPNPSQGKVTLSYSDQEIQEINIVNLIGLQEKIDFIPAHHKVQLDLSKYSNGVYTIQILTNNGWVSKKLILSE